MERRVKCVVGAYACACACDVSVLPCCASTHCGGWGLVSIFLMLHFRFSVDFGSVLRYNNERNNSQTETSVDPRPLPGPVFAHKLSRTSPKRSKRPGPLNRGLADECSGSVWNVFLGGSLEGQPQ